MSSNSKQSKVSQKPSERNLKDAASVSAEENPYEELDHANEPVSMNGGDSLVTIGNDISDVDIIDVQTKSGVITSKKLPETESI